MTLAVNNTVSINNSTMTKLLVLSLLVTLSTASINLPKHVEFKLSKQRHNDCRGSALSQPSYSNRNCAFIDPKTLAKSIGTFYATKPYTAAFYTGAVKGAAADICAQRAQAKQTAAVAGEGELRGGSNLVITSAKIDWKRTLSFLLYAGFYQGIGLEFFYNTIFPAAFGADSIMGPVLASMFVLSPLVTLPVAYLVKAFVFGDSPTAALQKYVHDVNHAKLLTTYWKIWIPVQCLVFGVVPAHLRIVFTATISFAWMILFSMIQSSSE